MRACVPCEKVEADFLIKCLRAKGAAKRTILEVMRGRARRTRLCSLHRPIPRDACEVLVRAGSACTACSAWTAGSMVHAALPCGTLSGAAHRRAFAISGPYVQALAQLPVCHAALVRCMVEHADLLTDVLPSLPSARTP